MFRRKRHHEEEEGESIFVSMTDLTVSILMIVIILLGFFASQMRDVHTLEELASLKEILVERDQQVADQAEQIAALQAALSAEESARRRFETLYETAIAEIEELNQAQDDLQANMSAEIAALEDEKLLLQSEYDVLLKTLEVSTVENERLRKSVESLTEKLTAAMDDLAAAELALDAASDTITSLEDQVAELALSNAALEESRADLLNLRDNLIAERDDALGALAVSERLVTKLNSEIASKERAAEELSARIASLEDDLTGAHDEIGKLTNELSNEQLKRQNAEAAHQSAIAENATQREEISEFKYQIAVLEGERDALSAARQALVSERDALQIEIAGRDADLADLERKLETGNLNLKRQEAEHAKAIEALETELANQKSEILVLMDDIETGRTAIATLQATLANREGDLVEARAELAATQQALSEQTSQVAALERLQGSSVSAVADLERAMEVLRFDLQQSLRTLSEAAEEKRGLEDEIDELQIENATLNDRAEINSAKLEAAEIIKGQLEEEIAGITAVYSETLAALGTSEQNLAILQSDLLESETDRAELAERVTALSNDAAAFELRIAELEVSLSDEITQRTDAEAQLSAALSAHTQTTESLNATFAELETAQAARDLAQTQLDEISALLAVREEELATTIEQRDAARTDAAAKASRLATGDENFQELQKQFQIQRIVLMLRQARFDRTTQEAEDLNAKLAAADAEIARLQSELAALGAESEVEAGSENAQ